MKTLYLVRHAKSSWKVSDLADHERPLLEKGKKRLKKVIDLLLREKVVVDFVLCSSALRARETASFLTTALHIPESLVKYDPALYIADEHKLFDQFLDLSDNFKAVMLIGHNPAMTNFVNHFLSPAIDWLPTSGVVVLEFETDQWEQIKTSVYKVKMVLFPKLID